MTQKQSWSKSDTKFKHVSLTHFIRRHYLLIRFHKIIQKCDVSTDLGALPPQLCSLIPVNMRATAKNLLVYYLIKFWQDNEIKIRTSTENMEIDMPDVSALFNTKCQMKTSAILPIGYSLWSGGFGVVCQMSCPEIDAKYAVKYFLAWRAYSYDVHGPYHEIPTAFAACHAEKKHNCRVYMASLNAIVPFMMSHWGGDVNDGLIKINKNEIFVTAPTEVKPCNMRNGQRIDFGDTRRTLYGATSYRLRKLYRQMQYAARVNNEHFAMESYDSAIKQHICHNNCDVWDLLYNIAYSDSKHDLCAFIVKCRQHQV